MVRCLCGGLLVLGLIATACKARPGPIEVNDNVVAIHNQTSRDWRNVVVTGGRP